jgi:shikimate kinase
MVITLMGFMGSGKSSIGRRISKKSKMKLIDLDDYIVKKEKCSIAEIFKSEGESHFRKLESKYLKDILKSHKKVIIALGGGTPCQKGNWKMLKKTKSIYLKRSESYLFNRLKDKKEQRPLIQKLNDKELKDLISTKLSLRAPYYEKAEFIIDMDLSKKEMTKVILDIIKVRKKSK